MPKAKPARKVQIADRVRVRVYPIVADRVETAIDFGWARAHKHTATPGETEIKAQIESEVTAALCDLFDFDPEVGS